MSAGGPPPLYQFRGSKHDATAFFIHSYRILSGTERKQFEGRPGKTYLKAESSSEVPYVAQSLNMLCQHYGLEPTKSFQQSEMDQHFEIMGELLGFYNRKFITDAELGLHVNWIRDNSVEKTFVDRPDKTYLFFKGKDIGPAKIEEALKKVCDYHQLDYSSSFRQSGMDQHFEIMGELLGFYNRKFITDAELGLHVNWIRDNSVEKTFVDRPGQIYRSFKDIEPAKIEEALKKVCDYYQLDYSKSFRQSSLSSDLYEIKGKLLELSALYAAPTRTESALTDPVVSPSRIRCR